MLPEPLPGLGVVGDAPVDGEVLVEGDALVDGLTSGDTLGDGDVAACTAMVPNPPTMPTAAATTILATGPRIQPRLSKLITSLAAMRWPIATGSSMSMVAFQFHDEFREGILIKARSSLPIGAFGSRRRLGSVGGREFRGRRNHRATPKSATRLEPGPLARAAQARRRDSSRLRC